MQIEDHRVKKQEIYDIGFINTNIIDEFLVKKDVKEAEDNLLRSLIKKIKTKIPYSFLTTAIECYCRVHIRFPLLLERGYSNVIDELCMRAQVPLCSSGD